MVLPFNSLIKPNYVNIQMDAIEQHFHVLLLIRFSYLVFRLLVDALRYYFPDLFYF